MKLLDIDIIEIIPNKKINKSYRKYYILKCRKCLNDFKIRSDYIKLKKECICKKCSKINSSTIHSFALRINGRRDRIYGIWAGMRSRCFSKSNDKYSYYGGKGITICEEWNDFMTFRKWALENGYKDSLTIDRRNGEDNYNSSNCRWVTKCVQSANTKRIRTNNRSGYKGVFFSKDKNRYIAKIQHENISYYLGCSKEALECAYMYDNYIIENNLEHTKNFKETK